MAVAGLVTSAITGRGKSLHVDWEGFGGLEVRSRPLQAPLRGTPVRGAAGAPVGPPEGVAGSAGPPPEAPRRVGSDLDSGSELGGSLRAGALLVRDVTSATVPVGAEPVRGWGSVKGRRRRGVAEPLTLVQPVTSSLEGNAATPPGNHLGERIGQWRWI